MTNVIGLKILCAATEKLSIEKMNKNQIYVSFLLNDQQSSIIIGVGIETI